MKEIVFALCVTFLGLLPPHRAGAQVRIHHLLCENLVNPLGLDVPRPRLSWQLLAKDNQRDIRQTAYELRVAATPAALTAGRGEKWSSGKVLSDSSVHVVYTGPPLTAGRRYYWQVRAWDQRGRPGAWSAPAYWQAGLLTPANWRAAWITPGYQEDSVRRPSPLLRKEFRVSKPLRSATAYITAHGLYEAHLNGRRVGDAYLTPGWTSYDKRLAYQTYDVTDLLKPGANAVGVTLASGWYRGFIGYRGDHNIYGSDVALLFQLDLTYADGTTETVVSDGSWQSTDTGPVRYAELQQGETYDARREQPWTTAGFAAAGWAGVRVRDFGKQELFASFSEPIRAHETRKVVKVLKSPKGETIFDFGQNLVGWVRVRARGKAGDKITLSHAEVLDKRGNFYLANLRSAKAEDTYYLRGTGQPETFEPHFTYHGFRYLRVDAYPGSPDPADFTAVALYSDMPATGEFSCSNPLVNQLQQNIQWGQKGNFLDVPTDCPQRDERLGWTGDAQVFCRTAAFNRNTNSFFAKWLRDLAADQTPTGAVPWVIPRLSVVNGPGPVDGAAGWSDAATVIPWDLYTVYGDRRVLATQYPSMKAWGQYILNASHNDLWNTGWQFGDWLAYDLDDDTAGRSAVTNRYLVAQCFWARSTQLLINAATVLGKTEDVATYTALLARIKAAFMREYVTPSGALVSSSQTAYVLALHFDMLPENLRAQAADRLVRNVAEYRNHLTTGFLGTPYLCEVLSRFGHADVAYTLLLQTTYPSWLYPVKMGATTVWERWDSMRPDSTFAPPSMTSFNHYAYGAVGNWLYTNVAGLNTDSPAYHHFSVRPRLGGGLTHAAARLDTYYGPTRAAWQLTGDALALDVTVPPNATATVYVPGSAAEAVRESGRKLPPAQRVGPAQDGYVPVSVGSGTYHFTVPYPAGATATRN